MSKDLGFEQTRPARRGLRRRKLLLLKIEPEVLSLNMPHYNRDHKQVNSKDSHIKSNWFLLDFLCRAGPNRKKNFPLADLRFAADGYQKMLILLKSLIIRFFSNSMKNQLI